MVGRFSCWFCKRYIDRHDWFICCSWGFLSAVNRIEAGHADQSMGILFTVSTLALIFSLHGNEFLNLELGIWSSISVVPAIVGMVIGQRIRKGLSEKTFRKLFFLIILAIGTYIVVTAKQNFIFSVN